MKLKFLISVFLISAVAVSAKKTKKDKNQIPPGHGKHGVKSLETCEGQTVELASSLQNVDSCLETKLNWIISSMGNGTDDKAIKKREKRRKKLTKKLKKKCAAECEWKSFELIPTRNNGTADPSSVSSQSIETFANKFPASNREAIKSGIQTCLKTSSGLSKAAIANAHRNQANQMCSKNKKLVKCYWKTMKNICKIESHEPEKGNGKKSEEDDDDDHDKHDDDEASATSSTPITR